MKDLIRHILKEETEDNEKKGIDLAIKLLKKSYPYIVGWEYNNVLDTPSKFTIYLNIICDVEKVKEFYDSELKPYYRRQTEDWKKRQEFAYPTSILFVDGKIDDQVKYDNYKIMKEELNEIYEMLPDHLVVKDLHGEAKTLDPDKFKFI